MVERRRNERGKLLVSLSPSPISALAGFKIASISVIVVSVCTKIVSTKQEVKKH
jgi:hypothetical protein